MSFSTRRMSCSNLLCTLSTFEMLLCTIEIGGLPQFSSHLLMLPTNITKHISSCLAVALVIEHRPNT
jgi:hypothetical protein